MELKKNEELLTPKEAALYAKLSPETGFITVRKWVREGRLRAGRAGDLIRIRKRDLDDFLFHKS